MSAAVVVRSVATRTGPGLLMLPNFLYVFYLPETLRHAFGKNKGEVVPMTGVLSRLPTTKTRKNEIDGLERCRTEHTKSSCCQASHEFEYGKLENRLKLTLMKFNISGLQRSRPARRSEYKYFICLDSLLSPTTSNLFLVSEKTTKWDHDGTLPPR
jgi:hypothetical protein